MRYLYLFLFIPALSFAYTAQNIKLNNYKFSRWVRPQLKSITLDYQTLLIILNPEFKDYKPAFSSISRLKLNSYRVGSACKNSHMQNCLKEIEKSLELTNKLIKLTKNPINLTEKPFFNDGKILTSFEQYNTYLNSVLELQQRLYSTGLALSGGNLKRGQIQKLKHLVYEVDINFNIYLLKNSDERFQPDFIAYWSNFIKPIQNLILPQNDKDIFLRYLNQFNIRWNTLGVALTKRNKHISKSASGMIKTIGNRWNNILKTTLRN